MGELPSYQMDPFPGKSLEKMGTSGGQVHICFRLLLPVSA